MCLHLWPAACFLLFAPAHQETERRDKTASATAHPNIGWFKDAKFGMFIHWGLFAQSGGSWQGKKQLRDI